MKIWQRLAAEASKEPVKVLYLKVWKARKTCSKFGLSRAAAWPHETPAIQVAGHECPLPRWLIRANKRPLFLLEPFRIIVVLNHLEVPYNSNRALIRRP